MTAVKFRVTEVKWEDTAICQEGFKTPGGLVEFWEVWEEKDGRCFGQGSYISYYVVSVTFKPSSFHLVSQPVWYCWRVRTCSQVTSPQKGSYSCSFSSHVPLRCEVPYASGSHLHCACVQPSHALPHFDCLFCCPFSCAGSLSCLGGPARSQYSSRTKSKTAGHWQWLFTAQGSHIPWPSLGRSLLRDLSMRFAHYTLHRVI